MAPKSRRNKAKFRRPVQQRPASSATPITATVTQTATASRPNTAITAQYNYVINDLKLIGGIAGSMILIIIILSFIL